MADFLLANKCLLLIVIQGGLYITKQLLKDFEFNFALQEVSEEGSSLLWNELEFEEEVYDVQTIHFIPFYSTNVVLL